MIQNTLTKFSLERIIKNALYEDLGQNGDITSNSIINVGSDDIFYMSAREDGTLSGLSLAGLTFEIMDKGLEFSPYLKDGDRIKKRLPNYKDFFGEGGLINLHEVTNAFNFLYHQKKEGWTFELDLRTNKENW